MTTIERLYKRLQSHKETGCENISDLVSLANKANGEYNQLQKEKEEWCEGLPEEIKTDRDGGILYIANNLLDQQLMEAFAGCLTNPKVNHLQFLQILQGIAQHGITKVDAVETAY